jgi:hypothetical protein
MIYGLVYREIDIEITQTITQDINKRIWRFSWSWGGFSYDLSVRQAVLKISYGQNLPSPSAQKKILLKFTCGHKGYKYQRNLSDLSPQLNKWAYHELIIFKTSYWGDLSFIWR